MPLGPFHEVSQTERTPGPRPDTPKDEIIGLDIVDLSGCGAFSG